jgi:hypothetical protein
MSLHSAERLASLGRVTGQLNGTSASRTLLRRRVLVCAVALSLLRAGPAFAEASAEDRAAAQGLFDEGRALVEQGRPAEACGKFEESQRLDPGIGTQFHLADCFERTGRMASAWTMFLEIAAATRSQGQHEREAAARERAERIAARVSRITLVVPEGARVEGLTLQRGGRPVGPGQWGSAIPADPGEQRVVASAPGHETWSTTIVVPGDGQSVTVTVPRLEEASEDAAAGLASTGAPPDEGGPSAWRISALALGGAGILGLGIGTAFGAIALSKKSDAGCDGPACDSAEGVTTYREAQDAASVATIAFIAGGVALGAGLVLFLTEPEPERHGGFVRARFAATPRGGAIVAEGAF